MAGEELNVMVCDLGFSAMKYKYMKKRGRFFSVFQSDGGKTLFGEDALIATGASYLKSMEDLVANYPMFCDHTAKLVGATPGKTHLVVGLPYAFWAREKAMRNEGAIGTLVASLKAEGFAEVSVLPQGLGGIRVWTETHPDEAGNVLGIDIGFNTVIFTLYNVGRQRIVYGNTFNKRGVHQMVTKHLLHRISNLAPSRTFSPLEINYLMERGFIQYGFERYDITGEIRAAAEEYLGMLIAEIASELRAHVGDAAYFDAALVFGGGARLVGDHLSGKGRNVNLVVMDEPEFANTEGFHLIVAGGERTAKGRAA